MVRYRCRILKFDPNSQHRCTFFLSADMLISLSSTSCIIHTTESEKNEEDTSCQRRTSSESDTWKLLLKHWTKRVRALLFWMLSCGSQLVSNFELTLQHYFSFPCLCAIFFFVYFKILFDYYATSSKKHWEKKNLYAVSVEKSNISVCRI